MTITKSTKTLRHQVGSLFIVGLEDMSLSSMETAWLRSLQPSGIILFRRNIESAKQIHGLFRSLSTGPCSPLERVFFRCIDLEGGTVDRLRDLVGPTPSAADVAATGKLALYKKHGWVIGRMLAALGFNVDFAPVLDLATPACRTVMGTRVVGNSPAIVTQYAKAFLTGLTAHGVHGCGKHFPGLGSGMFDSHQATPKIYRTLKQMEPDMAPYRTLRSRLPFVMVNHAAYPKVDRSRQPASLSRFWITEILRKQIGYRGLVLSDDMEMGGVLNHASIEEASVQAIAAGTDLIEVCHRADRIIGSYEAILREAERSPAFARIISTASTRVLRSKQRLLGHHTLPRAASAAKIGRLRVNLRQFAKEIGEQPR